MWTRVATLIWLAQQGLDENGDEDGKGEYAWLTQQRRRRYVVGGRVDQGLSQRGTQTLGADGGDEMLEVLLQMIVAIRTSGEADTVGTGW